jgi:hypothetical protein
METYTRSSMLINSCVLLLKATHSYIVKGRIVEYKSNIAANQVIASHYQRRWTNDIRLRRFGNLGIAEVRRILTLVLTSVPHLLLNCKRLAASSGSLFDNMPEENWAVHGGIPAVGV